MMAIALVFYSLVLIIGTWVIARRPAKTMGPEADAELPLEVINAQAEAIHKQVAEQTSTVEAIHHEADHFDLAGYLNQSHKGP